MKNAFKVLCLTVSLCLLFGCSKQKADNSSIAETSTQAQQVTQNVETPEATAEASETTTKAPLQEEQTNVTWNENWEYADFSSLHDDSAILHKYTSSNPKNKTVCINAGHGTRGGSSKKTYCHPDKTPKVTGGSTAAGSLMATAIAEGTTMLDGTPEADVTLSLALILKDKLLCEGYDVLMIRETSDSQLDNIARTVFANNNADCHISIHYDSTETDKGLFYLSVPNSSTYRAMKPVSENYVNHLRLGDAIVQGSKNAGVKIFSDGYMPIDLTQTSYSTVPSVDVEVGDRASDYSVETQTKIAQGILNGVNIFFNK